MNVDSDFECTPRVGPIRKVSQNFEKELTDLLNNHQYVVNVVDMPDFMLARLLCRVIEAIGDPMRANLDWHGCDSVCHPAPKPHDKVDSP